MNVSEPFIRRPIATSLLMLGVLVFGITAYRLLPVSSLPNVDFPTITVSANLPGASPETMASAVATPLEQQFSAVNGLSEMTSLSGVGTTTITLQFDLSTDINAAAEDVQTAINAASGLLPKDLPSPPTYRKVNPNNFPVLIYAVHSDAMPGYQLDHYVSDVLAQPLSMVHGVGGVFIFGQKKYAVRVEANPTALAARHIGLEAVRAALANATVNLPKGEIVGPNRAVSLDSNDQLLDAAPYRNIVIAYRDGAPVHLGDVATIVNSEENTQVGAWYDSIPSEGLAIERANGSNALAVIDAVKAAMPRLERSLPPSVKVELMSDRSELTQAAITDVQYTMLLTIGLVIMVIFVFLRSVWATLIPSLVVPLSLLATFAVMYVAGYTLDNISLMGLDDRSRLPDRRRDRDDREHRAPHRGGRASAPGRAQRRRADRVYHHLDHVLADRRVHSDLLHGRRRRTFVPRICRHRCNRRPGLRLLLFDPDARAVFVVPEVGARTTQGPAEPGGGTRLRCRVARV